MTKKWIVVVMEFKDKHKREDEYSVETVAVAVTCRMKERFTHGPPNNFFQHPELL